MRVWKLRPGAPAGSGGVDASGDSSTGGEEVDEAVVGGGMQPVTDGGKYHWTAGLVAEFDDHELVLFPLQRLTCVADKRVSSMRCYCVGLVLDASSGM